MAQGHLNSALRCAECGTVRLDLPKHDDDVNTIVTCSTCRKPMGTWGELQNEFMKQAGSGVFSIEDGQFIKR
jgi:uncharacterized Zn finger protein